MAEQTPNIPSINPSRSLQGLSLATRVRRPIASIRGPITPSNTGRSQRLLESLGTVSQALNNLAESERKRKIQNDVITAKTAFALNKELPGGLAPEAELAYNQLTAVKSTRNFFKDFELQHSITSNEILSRQDMSPVDKQRLHDDNVDSAVDRFIQSAQFNEAQLNTIQEVVNAEKLRMQNDFVKMNTEDILDRKMTDVGEYARREAETLIDAADIAQRESDEPIELSEFFTPEFHENLQNNIRASLGIGVPRDQVDEIIIDQLGILATDPDNPQPDMLDYLDQKRKGGKPRFSSIKGLSRKIKVYQDRANRLFVAKQNQIQRAETDALKDKQESALQQAMQTVAKMISENRGRLDVAELDSILNGIPNLKGEDRRALVRYSAFIVTSPASSLSSLVDFELLKEDIQSGAYTNLADVLRDKRINSLGQKHMAELLGSWSEYKQGRINDNEQVMNSLGKTVKDEYAKLVIEHDPNLDFSELHFNVITNSYDYPADLEIKANNFKADYRIRARQIIRKFANQPEQIETELNRLRLDMLEGVSKEFNQANTDPNKQPFVPSRGVFSKPEINSKGPRNPVIEKELQEQGLVDKTFTKALQPTEIKTSSDISAINKFSLPEEIDPVEHIPVSEMSQFTSAARQGVNRAGKIFFNPRSEFDKFFGQERLNDDGSGVRKPQFSPLGSANSSQIEPQQALRDGRTGNEPALSRGEVRSQFPQEDVLGLKEFQNRSNAQKERQQKERKQKEEFPSIDFEGAFDREFQEDLNKNSGDQEVSFRGLEKSSVSDLFGSNTKPETILKKKDSEVISDFEAAPSFKNKKTTDKVTTFDDIGELAVGPGIRKEIWDKIAPTIDGFKGPKTLKKNSEPTKREVIQVFDKALERFREELKGLEKELGYEFQGSAKIAVLSLLYNTGLPTFKGSKSNRTNAFKALKKKDWQTFLEEAFGTKKGFTNKGSLRKRRQVEKFLYRNGSIKLDNGKIINLSKELDDDTKG